MASNFRQAGWGYTSNGGISWTFPGFCKVASFAAIQSSPQMRPDIFPISVFSRISLTTSGVRSTEDKRGPAWRGATGGDKQWFTIDQTNSSGSGFMYQSWSTAGNNYGGRQFTRSIDGGFTWLNPINIPNSPIWGTLDVDSNGTLFLGGVNSDTGQIWSVRSSNAKNGSVTPTFDLVTPVSLGGNIVAGEFLNPEGLLGQIFFAADRSGTITNNNLYLLASVQPFGFTSGTDVMFARSSDSGRSFTAPRRINDDRINHNKWHWFGTLSVAPNGRIDTVWLDTRNATNNTDSQLFYSYPAGMVGIPGRPTSAVSKPCSIHF